MFIFKSIGFIYPVAAHWVATKNGWLHQLGFDDFAFSGVVHAMSGATCLIAAYMTGPRLDRNFDGRKLPPHSVPVSFLNNLQIYSPLHFVFIIKQQMILGAFIFLFGMIAFNAGSQGSISQPGDGFVIAKVAINTLICAMTSAATALIYQRFIVDRLKKNWNYTSGINGSFVGMVYNYMLIRFI